MLALLLFLIGSAGTQTQTGWEHLENSPERLIGLLDLPDIVRWGCGAPVERATGRAYSAPSQNSAQTGTISMRDEGDAGCGLMFERAGGGKEKVPSMESGYEIPAAIVYERRGSWFRIGLANGSAWIGRNDAEDFLPYPDMLRERLVHTMQTWDGTLRETPGASGTVTPLSSGWKELLDRQLSIEYLGSRRVGNELWIHIRLMSEGACGQKLEGVAPVSGWIPAYHSDRSPSVWFSSRGC